MLIGDFNDVVSMEEFQGGSHYYSCEAHIFFDFIASNNLLDVNFIGPIFTWCNNQLRMARKWACLDRCLINSCFLPSLTLILLNTFHMPFWTMRLFFLLSLPIILIRKLSTLIIIGQNILGATLQLEKLGILSPIPTPCMLSFIFSLVLGLSFFPGKLVV